MSDTRVFKSLNELKASAGPDAPFAEAGEKWPAVMIDIETLGTGDDAVILEIGAVCFDREEELMGPEWEMIVDHVQQPGRVICPKTLQWWLDEKRIGHFQELTKGSDTKPLLWHALNELRAFLGRHLKEGGEVWAKGNFDARLLEHAFKADEIEVPWKYFQVRELRTVLKVAGVAVSKDATVHRALVDAREQVEQLGMALSVGRAVPDPAIDQGWEVYRRQLAETCGLKLREWNHMTLEVQECFAAGVWAAVEAGALSAGGGAE